MLRIRLSRKNRRGPDELRAPLALLLSPKRKQIKLLQKPLIQRSLKCSPDSSEVNS